MAVRLVKLSLEINKVRADCPFSHLMMMAVNCWQIDYHDDDDGHDEVNIVLSRLGLFEFTYATNSTSIRV